MGTAIAAAKAPPERPELDFVDDEGEEELLAVGVEIEDFPVELVVEDGVVVVDDARAEFGVVVVVAELAELVDDPCPIRVSSKVELPAV
jgi:hypothetical protein